ncbi:hypothetical protein [Rothia sp. ZJ932]|uniref:hypothetical protein n=1 Tax=Rothia sp. ZJ932 TaxID=2810516 RepID=UPI001967D602|nr:hypothetical protein [Rothia sp. ZJ932]QRZ60953.1 hypothetical protein JR346_06695 [Rothia sp. ZJ932]
MYSDIIYKWGATTTAPATTATAEHGINFYGGIGFNNFPSDAVIEDIKITFTIEARNTAAVPTVPLTASQALMTATCVQPQTAELLVVAAGLIQARQRLLSKVAGSSSASPRTGLTTGYTSLPRSVRQPSRVFLGLLLSPKSMAVHPAFGSSLPLGLQAARAEQYIAVETTAAAVYRSRGRP